MLPSYADTVLLWIKRRWEHSSMGERAATLASFGFLLLFLLHILLLSAPVGFEAPTVVEIERGKPLALIAEDLEEKGIVRSSFWFTLFSMLSGGERGAVAGNYYFAHPQNVITVAARISGGEYELEPVKVTLPEGATAKEMASILKQKLGNFDEKEFLVLAQGREGYLFPDTYYFLPGEKPETVILALEDTFLERIKTLQSELTAFGKPLEEVITMASLLEEEARTTESRRIIAGILWRRIAEGMRLQVDAVFPYIIGKNTFELTRADLAVDSPYNTYRNPGLPLGPISNPGLDSIRAAVTPIPTPYLFYLSDKTGSFHYSKTYEEHLRKKNRYLGS